MKAKKILAVLMAAGAVFFGQATISEAHAVEATKQAFTFASENFSLYSCDNFNYAATLRFKCRRCGQIITFNGNPNNPRSGIAYGCPGVGAETAEYYKDFGDRHYWDWIR